LASSSGQPWSMFRALVPGEVVLWDVATRQERATLRGHRGGIWSVSFAPDGKTLATASDDSSARVWGVASGREMLRLKHGGPVAVTAFAPDGKRLITGSYDQTIYHRDHLGIQSYVKPLRVWDPNTGEEMAALPTSADCTWCLAFAGGGRTLAGAQDDGTVT